MRNLYAALMIMAFLILGGCSSLPAQNPNDPAIVQAKAFTPAPKGKGYVYLFRDYWLARQHSYVVYLGDETPVDIYNKSFFLLKLEAGTSYKLASESEFGNEEVVLNIESGKTYYVRHTPRLGVLFGQSDLDLLTKPDDIKDAQESIMVSRMNNP